MEEALIFLLSNAVVRTFLEGLCIKIVAEVFHRRATDPAFLYSSDAAFSQFASAKTDQEKSDALLKIQSLMVSSS